MGKGTIIYAGYFELPDKNAAANRVTANGKIFTALGFNVIYLGADYSDDRFGGIAQLDGHKNMYVERHANSVKQWVHRVLSVDNIAHMLDMYPDTKAVILYNSPALYAKMVSKYLKGSKIKLFYDCTEWTKYTEGNLLKRFFKMRDEKFVRNNVHKYVDGMIVVGSVMRRHYENKTKVLVLPPLVDTTDPIWHQEVKPAENFEFCFAGVPGGNKESLDKIVEAFMTIKEPCSLKIAGLTFRDFLYQYKNFDKIVPDNVTFTGYRSHKTSISYVLGCDAYIFIRQKDRRNNAGFPTKFSESFTAGKPIITTGVSDIPLYLKNGENGYIVNPDDIEEIASAMKKVMTQGRQSNSLRKDFDFTAYIDKTADWLKKTGML